MASDDPGADIVHRFFGNRLGPGLGIVNHHLKERCRIYIAGASRWSSVDKSSRLTPLPFANSPIIPSASAEYYGVRFTLFGHFPVLQCSEFSSLRIVPCTRAQAAPIEGSAANFTHIAAKGVVMDASS